MKSAKEMFEELGYELVENCKKISEIGLKCVICLEGYYIEDYSRNLVTISEVLVDNSNH